MVIVQKIKEFYSNNKKFVWLAVLVILIFAYSDSFGVRRSGSSFDSESIQSSSSLGLLSATGSPSSYKTAPAPRSSSQTVMSNEAGQVADVDKKISKNASIQLETKKENYDNAKNKINEILEKYKGFYTNQNENKQTINNTDYHTFYITIKFPISEIDKAVNELKTVGKLQSFDVNASDLTTQYYDTKSYLDSTIAVKDRIQKLLEQTERIEEIITIEQKLSDLQRQIDNYQQQLNNLDRITDYSQVSVVLSEERKLVDPIFEMTKFKDLIRNTINSFDNVFVMISRLIGYVVLYLVIWGIYKITHRTKK